MALHKRRAQGQGLEENSVIIASIPTHFRVACIVQALFRILYVFLHINSTTCVVRTIPTPLVLFDVHLLT